MVRAVVVQCSSICPDQGSSAAMDVRLLTVNTEFEEKTRLLGIVFVENLCISSRACLRIYLDLMTYVSVSLESLH